jgi:uncharacterized cupin superfamily protein
MKIYHIQDALRVRKPEGTNVTYFLFPEYEVHFNEQIPHSSQIWHHHEKIWESLYIIEGELTAKWRENDIEKSEVVRTGDLIEIERSSHTFSNESDSTVKFLVIKRMPTGQNYTEVFKVDKVVDY